MRWFYWYVHYTPWRQSSWGGAPQTWGVPEAPRETVIQYGPEHLDDGQAFALEVQTRSQNPGTIVFHRYVGIDGAWVRDTRTDDEFLFAADVPNPPRVPTAPVKTALAKTKKHRASTSKPRVSGAPLALVDELRAPLPRM
jgi:hypothetical protein